MNLDAMQNEGAGRALLGLLRRQAALHAQLEALGRTQQALVAAEDTQPLLKVLAQRQRLTGELQTVAAGLAPLRRDWTRLLEALPETERREARELVNAAKACISRLISADEEDAKKLQIRKQRTADALRSTQLNRRAVAAYSGSAPAGANCLDRTHEDA